MNSLNTHKNQFEKMAVIIFVLILFQAVGNSQNDASFTQLSLEKGVALNLTYDMLQDSEGYLWFGTMYGLVRYDGINYKTFTYNPG
jgi:ligand-binding sensor domain-containing protein